MYYATKCHPLQMPSIEAKFDRKLGTPFYGQRITIKDSSFRKLRSRVGKCADRAEDPVQFRNAVYTRLFLALYRAGTSSAVTSIIGTQGHIRDFASRTPDFLEWFYTLDCRRAITGMQTGKGMPTEEMVQKVRMSRG